MKQISRRNFIAGSAAFAFSSLVLHSSCKSQGNVPDEDGRNIPIDHASLEVEKHFVIQADSRFNTLPAVTRMTNGQVTLIYREAPDWQARYGRTEIDHDARIMKITVARGGALDAASPTELYSHFLHGVDRPSIRVLKDGTLFCTYVLWQVDVKTPSNALSGVPVFDNWVGRIRGTYSIRSTDGGQTWDAPAALPTQEMLGSQSVELPDGALICSSFDEDLSIYTSRDRGRTWSNLSTIRRPAGYSFGDHVLFRTDSGNIVCFAKGVPAGSGATRLITVRSGDDGKSWSQPRVEELAAIGTPHLLRLRSDAVLLSYKTFNASTELRGAVLNGDCDNLDAAEHQVLHEGLGDEDGGISGVLITTDTLLLVYANADQDGQRYIAGSMCRF